METIIKAPQCPADPATIAVFGDANPPAGSEVPYATPSQQTVTVAGTVAAGALSLTITNTGGVAATVAGNALAAGGFVSWTAPDGSRLKAVAYDPGVGGSLKIVKVV